MHDSLSAHFPVWQGYLSVLPLLAIGPLAYLAARLALVGPAREARKEDGAHWTERARRTFRVWTTAWAVGLYAAAIAAAFAAALAGPFAALSRGALILPACVFAGAGAYFGALAAASGLGHALRTREHIRLWLIRALVWRGPAIATVMAFCLPSDLDVSAVVACGMACVSVAFAPIPIRLLRAIGLIAEAPERVHAALRPGSARRGIRVRGVHRIPTIAVANAAAVPAPFHQVLVTDGLLEVLDDRQLAAVLGHELGHLTESRWSAVFRYLVSLAWLPLVFMQYVLRAHGVLAGIAMVLAVLGLLVVANGVSRRLEGRADAQAAEDDAVGLASALEAMCRYNSMPVVLKGGTHPSTYDRLVAIGATPDYARPRPPDGPAVVRALICVGLSLGLFCAAYYDWAQRQVRAHEGSDDLVAYATAASLTGGSLIAVEHLRDHEPDPRQQVWYDEAIARENGMAWAAHDAAIANSRIGRCDVARAWLAEGRRRSPAVNERSAAAAVAACQEVGGRSR